ncbi:hypothetical protein Q7P37_002353 [Cladosporium fusiforme]
MAAPRPVLDSLTPEIRNQIYHLVFEDVTKIDEKTECDCTLAESCTHTTPAYQSISKLKPFLSIVQTSKIFRLEAGSLLFGDYIQRIGWSIKGHDEAPARLVGFLNSMRMVEARRVQICLQVAGSDRDEAVIQRDNAFAANILTSIRRLENNAAIGHNQRTKMFHNWLHLHRFRGLPFASMGSNTFKYDGSNHHLEFKIGHNVSDHCLLVSGPLGAIVQRDEQWAMYYKHFLNDRKNYFQLSMLPADVLYERYRVQMTGPIRPYIGEGMALSQRHFQNVLGGEHKAGSQAKWFEEVSAAERAKMQRKKSNKRKALKKNEGWQ